MNSLARKLIPYIMQDDAVDRYLKTHTHHADRRIMLPLLWVLFITGLGLASWYDTWSLALGAGGLLAVVPSWLIWRHPGTRLSRITVAISFMLFCALHIHQAMGVTELHFGIFVLLAVLLCYRDWLVIVVAAAVAAIHHLSFNALQQWVFRRSALPPRAGAVWWPTRPMW